MELELNKWYKVEDLDSNLELEMEDINDNRVGLLLSYENGIIEFEKSPCLKGNKDLGRDYYVINFMLIKY